MAAPRRTGRGVAAAANCMTMRHWNRLLRDPRSIQRHRFLRPLQRWLPQRTLWAVEREPVARGVAIGLFFGILTPVAQILFAAVAAIVLRANLPLAAMSTLITNPFTFPFVYYLAYSIGLYLTGGGAEASPDVALSDEIAEHTLDVTAWIPALLKWASSIGPRLALGVVTLATASAVLGYVLVHGLWSWRAWRQARSNANG